MKYFLFKIHGNMYRIEKAKTLQEACKLAFGVVYGKGSGITYKDIGTKNPKYVSNKVKEEWYSESNWNDMS